MGGALLVIVAITLAGMTGHSHAAWCVCKEMSDTVLQKTLDYACGAGADCNPIHTSGPCWNPNTVRAHCNYAVNSYFQKKGQSQGACDFAGTAALASSDPSTAGCSYPSSASTAGSTTTTTTPVSSTTPTTGTTTTTTSPYTNTPSNGVLGGVGPSSVNNDYSHAGLTINSSLMLVSGLMLLAACI